MCGGIRNYHPRSKEPEVESRRGPALRCHDLAIGYDDLEVASGIAIEIEHGERVAVVGDIAKAL